MSGVTRSTTPAFIKEINCIWLNRSDCRFWACYLSALTAIAPGSRSARTPRWKAERAKTRPRVRILRQTRAGAVDPQQHKTDSGIKNNKSLHLHLIIRRCSEFQKPLHLHLLKKSSMAFIIEGGVMYHNDWARSITMVT